MIPDVIITKVDPPDPPELRLVSRVTFDPPLTVHNDEVVRLTYSMTPAGDIEVKDAQVMPAPEPKYLAERELRGEIVSMLKAFPEGIRICDLESELVAQGFEFGQADLRTAVWSLVAIRKLELSPNSIITVHTPEE